MPKAGHKTCRALIHHLLRAKSPKNWASDIAKIAQTHITRIKGVIAKTGTYERQAFDDFLEEIRDDLNESITEDEAIEMLAQHLITKPVFDALFEGYSFTENNPVSIAMQYVLNVLQEQNIEKESKTLEGFYDSVKRRAKGIDNAEAKQKIIVELYDKFFRTAFPKMTEKLGIVYTPVEVVDFIIHSVNDVLKNEFGQTLGSKGVHIIDPFTGTGTFITRLLQSGLISPEELEHKYKNEIHANEIVLLAYYIAAINIEAVYHSQSGGEYVPFEGICLTDTFQLYEQKEDLISHYMPDNSNRRTKQKSLDIRVIMGNPPYSAGQKSANDNNANVSYKKLDDDIANSYAKYSTATNKNSLYDSYIRAIKWGSDRLGNAGVMAYVSNAGWIDGNAMDGLRKCLVDEFSSLYIFHLRGNARTQGEQRRKEKDNVFGQGTRTPIVISLLVKNPNATEQGKIYFHDIGDYLSQKEKLEIISNFRSINGISSKNAWQSIVPDEFNDWVGQRDLSFDSYIPAAAIGNGLKIFELHSNGISTNRDAWVYCSALNSLNTKISGMIDFYNSEVERTRGLSKIEASILNNDPRKISWSSSLVSKAARSILGKFEKSKMVISSYRPFSKQYLYYDGMFNHRTSKMPLIFPNGETNNLVITFNSSWNGFGQCVLISKHISDLHFNGDVQSFPLYLYDAPESNGLFAGSNEYIRRDAITNDGLKHFQNTYPDCIITKEDIFYYVYGLLHSEDYRTRFADNLSKQLPRIPCVKTARDFLAFVEAGRELGEMHVNFETYPEYPLEFKQGNLFDPAVNADPVKFYRVEKMKFGGKAGNRDKATIIYNSNITIQNIPLDAYDYVVNGKPAIDWVVERQCVKTDKDSGIVNDANDYANETMQNPKYPLELLARVINISLRTMEIVRNLPKLEI